MINAEPIIFMDETTYNTWLIPKYARKTWQHKDEPIHCCVNSSRLSNVTIYGAVSNFMPLVFMVGTSTNKEEFKSFLIELKKKIQPLHLSRKPTLVLDHHSVHHAHAVRRHYDGFSTLFTPAYSSFLNSQETVWAALKVSLSQHFARLPYEVTTQLALIEEVEAVLKSFKASHSCKDFVNSVREEFEKLI